MNTVFSTFCNISKIVVTASPYQKILLDCNEWEFSLVVKYINAITCVHVHVFLFECMVKFGC
mgnify:CR=1 FL=1